MGSAKITRADTASSSQRMTGKTVWLEQRQGLKKWAERWLGTNLAEPLAMVRTMAFALSENEKPWRVSSGEMAKIDLHLIGKLWLLCDKRSTALGWKRASSSENFTTIQV